MGAAQETCQWFCAGTLSFEIVKGLPAVVIAALVGLFVAGISLRQYQVAKAKLKLDLFDRRYAIFEATWTVLSDVVQGGSSSKVWPSPLANEIARAGFLFEPEVKEYLLEINVRLAKMWSYDTTTTQRGGTVAPEDIAPRHETMTWLADQLAGCRVVFAPYLDLSKWR